MTLDRSEKFHDKIVIDEGMTIAEINEPLRNKGHWLISTAAIK